MNKIHRPFLYLTPFFSLGIMCVQWVHFPFSYLCFFSFIFVIASAATSKKEFTSTIFLLLAVLSLGMIYIQARQCIDRDHIISVAKYYRKKPITVRGVVVSSVTKRNVANSVKHTFTLNVYQVQANWGWERRTGTILVNTFRDYDLSYGDDLQLEGKLHRPYNFSNETNFSYRDYLQNRGIYFILSVKKSSNIRILAKNKGHYFKRHALRLRAELGRVLSENLSKNESGIMKAILLGDRSAIAKPVRALFVQTGTAHILAISGLHIGVVAALFLLLSKMFPIGGKWRSVGVIGLLVCYAFITGGRPSVVRATIMMIVFLTSFIVEKERDILNTLCLAAMIILIYNPLNLFDVGFQLSFVCVLSIILFNNYLKQIGSTRSLRAKDIIFERYMYFGLQSLTISAAIWVGVAGFIAYYFGIVTPVTIFANLLVVPLISIIVTLGFGLLILGAIAPSWAYLFAMCLKIVLNAMVGIIFVFDKIPFAYFYLRDVRIWQVVVYYIVLTLLVVVVSKLPLGRIDKRLRV